jgi:regulator of protease activity HflC (stomatin/prohibitin superfamily)
MNPITLFLTFVSAGIGALAIVTFHPGIAAGFFVLAVLIAASLKMANAWERFVILRAGKLQGVK